MKKILLMLSLILCGIQVHAQSPHKIALSTSIGTGIDLSVPSYTPIEWYLQANYPLNRYWRVGLGTGLMKYEKPLLPLYFDTQVSLKHWKRCTLFAQCDTGYSLALAHQTNGGFYLHPAIGLDFRVYGTQRFFVTLGYELQELERVKRYNGDYFSAEMQEALSHNLLAIHFGVRL